jgi:hypothetical protein
MRKPDDKLLEMFTFRPLYSSSKRNISSRSLRFSHLYHFLLHLSILYISYSISTTLYFIQLSPTTISSLLTISFFIYFLSLFPRGVPCCSLPALADVRSYARNSGREDVRYFTRWHKVARCSSFSSKSLLQDEIETPL